jgi:hypothetical protein
MRQSHDQVKQRGPRSDGPTTGVRSLFYYLLKDVDLALVWAAIQSMTWTEDAALAAIAAWNLATYGLVWMSVTPGLGFGRAMVMTQAASAVTNTVPTVGPRSTGPPP